MPDLARSYSPVVRENLSLNVDAFPILAKLNIPQIQAFTRGVATGGFSEIPTAEAKALFTDGLKTEAEIQSALNALDELLKQIAEQQSVLQLPKLMLTIILLLCWLDLAEHLLNLKQLA